MGYSSPGSDDFMTTTSFIGRALELKQLQQFSAGAHPAVAVVYGRRRVGKSFLLREALKGAAPLFFEALEERPKSDQIAHFLFQLRRQLDPLRPVGTLPATWKEALLELFEAIEAHPRPIVFDEFQWMANYRHELVSDLKYVWDNFFATLPGQKLILCGSIASFMIDKVIKSSAFYGRIDVQLQLSGFRLKETRELLGDKGEAEALEAHLFTGGIPKYLQLLGKYPSVQLGLQQLAFTPNQYFINEYERIFISHFGKNPDFESLVRTLAQHPLGLFREELAQKARVTPGGPLTAHLRDLESAGFISATSPFHKAVKATQVKYFLSDAYLRFYFSFILPNMVKIHAGKENLFAGIVQTGAFHAWMGRAFEYTCLQHALLISAILGFPGIDFTFGPYFVPPKKGKSPGLQVDLVFDRPVNVLTLCEMKYSTQPVGVEVIAEMERKVQLLEAVAKKKTIQRVLIVKEPVSSELARRTYFYRIIEARELFQ